MKWFYKIYIVLNLNFHNSSFWKFRLPLSAWQWILHCIEQSGCVASRVVTVLIISTSSFRTSKTCFSFCYISCVNCEILIIIYIWCHFLNYLMIKLPLFTKREVYPWMPPTKTKELKTNKMMQMITESIVDIVFHITFYCCSTTKIKKVLPL